MFEKPPCRHGVPAGLLLVRYRTPGHVGQNCPGYFNDRWPKEIKIVARRAVQTGRWARSRSRMPGFIICLWKS